MIGPSGRRKLPLMYAVSVSPGSPEPARRSLRILAKLPPRVLGEACTVLRNGFPFAHCKDTFEAMSTIARWQEVDLSQGDYSLAPGHVGRDKLT